MSELSDKNVSSTPGLPPGPRWWPLWVILALAVIVVVVLRQVPHLSEQHYIMNLGRVVISVVISALVWLLTCSRMPWRRRIGILVGTLSLIGLACACFQIRGVDGNLVPVLETRWSHRTWTQSKTNATPNATTNTVAKAAPSVASALPGVADFPQFLGPSRDAKLTGPNLGTNWTAQPPRLLWRQPIGTAWSGFAVSGSIAVTQEQRGEEELVTAYDLSTGRLLWSHSDVTRYFTTLAGEGPRANPALADGRVFTQGGTGRLNCLDLRDGHLLWTKDVLAENKVGVPSWGQSSSPLVFKDWVLIGAGGHHGHALVAYRVSDGSVAWNDGNEGATYSSPFAMSIDGVDQILLFGDSLAGHDAATGKVLWESPWPGGHPHVAMPVRVAIADVVVSSGYGTGSGRVSLRRETTGKWTATQVWRSNRLKAKFTNLLEHRGHLYGLDDGIMACLNAETGEFRWKDGKYGHGQELLVNGLLLVMAENGEVVLVDPQPDGLHELSRFRVLDGKTWNPPALAGEYLVVRNDKEAACYRMPLRGQN